MLRAGGTGRISAEAGLRELRRIVQIPPPVRTPWRFGGYCLMAVGLCLRQNPGLVEFIATLALSIPVAALLIAMPRLGRAEGTDARGDGLCGGAAVAVSSSTTSWSSRASGAATAGDGASGNVAGCRLLDILRGRAGGAARLVGGVTILVGIGLVASQAAFALTTPIEQPAE